MSCASEKPGVRRVTTVIGAGAGYIKHRFQKMGEQTQAYRNQGNGIGLKRLAAGQLGGAVDKGLKKKRGVG